MLQYRIPETDKRDFVLQEVNEVVQKVSGGDQPVSIWGDEGTAPAAVHKPMLFSLRFRLKVYYLHCCNNVIINYPQWNTLVHLFCQFLFVCIKRICPRIKGSGVLLQSLASCEKTASLIYDLSRSKISWLCFSWDCQLLPPQNCKWPNLWQQEVRLTRKMITCCILSPGYPDHSHHPVQQCRATGNPGNDPAWLVQSGDPAVSVPESCLSHPTGHDPIRSRSACHTTTAATKALCQAAGGTGSGVRNTHQESHVRGSRTRVSAVGVIQD